VWIHAQTVLEARGEVTLLVSTDKTKYSPTVIEKNRKPNALKVMSQTNRRAGKRAKNKQCERKPDGCLDPLSYPPMEGPSEERERRRCELEKR
jgi:hypothetical protein